MPTPEESDIYEDMFADPELPDENEPAYKLELFETMRAMGHGPERVVNDPDFAKDYAAWLGKHRDSAESV